MWNPFKKTEKRSQTTTSISTSENNVDAISLIFGNRFTNLQMNLASVFRAVSLISNTIAELNIHVMKYDSNLDTLVDAKTHPCYNLLLKSPNNYLNSFSFMKLMVEDILLRGYGVALVKRNMATGKVESINYIPNHRCNFVKKYDENGDIYEVLLNITGHKRLYERNEYIYIPNEIDPTVGFLGISTLSFASNCLKLASANEQAASNFFEQGSKLSGYIKVHGKITQNQVIEMKNSWKNSVDKGGIAVLNEAEDFVPVQINPTDAQMLESRKFSVAEIGRFFNVNPLLLYSESGTYSSDENARISFLQDCLQPIITKFETEFERILLTESERNRFEIKFSLIDFIKPNSKDLAEYYRTLWNFGVLSIAEIRSKLGFSKLEEQEWEASKEHYIQAQMCSLKYATELGSANNNNNVDNTLKVDEEETTEEDNSVSEETNM